MSEQPPKFKASDGRLGDTEAEYWSHQNYLLDKYKYERFHACRAEEFARRFPDEYARHSQKYQEEFQAFVNNTFTVWKMYSWLEHDGSRSGSMVTIVEVKKESRP